MRFFIFAACAASVMTGWGADLVIESFDYYGPFAVSRPLMVDSVDVKGKPLTVSQLAKAPAILSLAGPHDRLTSPATAPDSDGPAVNFLSFTVQNDSYATPSVVVEGLDEYDLYLDGQKVDGMTLTLTPATHNIAIRYVTDGPVDEPFKVSLNGVPEGHLTARSDGKRSYNIYDTLHGTRFSGVSISPDGRYGIANTVTTRRGGDSGYRSRVFDVATGQTVNEAEGYLGWMPKGSRWYDTVDGVDGQDLVAVDAATGRRETIARNLPRNARFTVTPDERKLIIHGTQEGHKEDAGVYQIREPEDRQPGWRDKRTLSVLDLATGVETPLVFGNRNISLLDIADDSQSLLLSVSSSRLEKRPTTVNTVLALDLGTMTVDTIAKEDGFVMGGCFGPDGSKVLMSGTPEAFAGIGLNLPEGRIPNMTETELFMVDRKSGKVTPLTKDFDPSVQSFEWSRADGRIWFNAEDRDCVSLFSMNPATGAIEKIPLPQDLASSFSTPRTGRNILWYGEGMATPQSLYVLDTKSGKSRLVDTPKADALADVSFGETGAWDFVNSRGDTICGRYYLPADFDPGKKYPMIVNYYGGCSPTSRNFESRYPHHAYAAQGYVVYVLQPSGATGFGQEFASRHVNTAGQGVAEDIIEGTKRFCEEHPFVDASKIGCIGASYGGFMTQYLQTVTDIFAAAISHAGISDHTSYWGEGYWGYSYSEVSMAESYPWSNPDLYVKQSPLYNADKIHTPLLFLHGDADVNVPVGESIQMFTALKLLGRPTAFVAVADQDHHILDYDKRVKWQNTIFAWFAKHLKGDSSWWDSMYVD